MESFVLLLFCLFAGVVLNRVPGFPTDAARGINAFIIYLSLPALVLIYVPRLEWNWQMALPALMSWIVLFAAWGLFHGLGRWLNWPRATVGCAVLCCGLGNTSFVGFPLVEYFYGPEGLKTAILCDQPGAFLALATVGMVIVGVYTGKGFSLGLIRNRVLTFPPFLAFLGALLVSLVGLPEIMIYPLEKIGGALAPLALFSVGLQLRRPPARFRADALVTGLGYKLLAAPALIWLLYVGLLGQRGQAIDISILEAAMAPMITPSIIAAENNLDPPLASLYVGVGIPISLLTVYGWHAWVLA